MVTNTLHSPRPVEELNVNWKRNGVRVTSGVHSFGRRLTISNPTSADTGAYVCEATLTGSAFEPATARAFLSIIGNAQPMCGITRGLRRQPRRGAPGCITVTPCFTGSLSDSGSEGGAEMSPRFALFFLF